MGILGSLLSVAFFLCAVVSLEAAHTHTTSLSFSQFSTSLSNSSHSSSHTRSHVFPPHSTQSSIPPRPVNSSASLARTLSIIRPGSSVGASFSFHTPHPAPISSTHSTDGTAFVVPTATRTLVSSVSLSTIFNPASATGAGYSITEHSKTIPFAVATIPASQLGVFPTGTDRHPAAVLLPGFLLPWLLFGGGLIVGPALSAVDSASIAAAGGITLGLYPNAHQAQSKSRTTAKDKTTLRSTSSTIAGISDQTFTSTLTVRTGTVAVHIAAGNITWQSIVDDFPEQTSPIAFPTPTSANTTTTSGSAHQTTRRSTFSASKSKGSPSATSTTRKTAPSSNITCEQPRHSNAVAGEALKNGITADDALQRICQTPFTPTDKTSITYNINFLDITVTRESADKPLQWCIPGLNEIINYCIVQRNSFGGVYMQGGETYTISNIGYPGNQNPLALPTLSKTRAPPTTTKPSVPHAHTITSNGMICVLIDGSNNPVCRPQSTPTPNPAGTKVHINSGCALVNGSPRCNRDAGAISNVYQSFYNVASDPKQPYSTTLILSGFDKSNDNHLHAMASCQLQARWPSNFGDVYFGADGCLYDSNSNRIFNQCCSKLDSNNSGPATNPYVAPPPQSPKQSSGNHDGSSICLSIHKNVCLAAASRFVDDIVYHQYTSAVWPDSSGADIVNAIFPIPIIGSIIGLVEELFYIHYGCTVIWTCDNQDAFNRGMTGKQIKDSMLNIYNLDSAKRCGSTYLNNSCHITVNGCNNCRDYGRGGTLWNPISVSKGVYGDAGDGFPPKR